MLATTTVDYSSKVKDLGRSTMGLLLLDFLDATIFEQGTATATSQLDATTPANQVVLGRIDPTEYTTLGLPLATQQPHKGWQSAAISDAAGVIAQQTLTITYPQKVSCNNFWWVADDVYHPVDFVVEYLDGTWKPLATATNHQDDYWTLRAAAPVSFTAIRIKITKVTPALGNVRLLTFGPVYRLVVDSERIVDFSILEDLYTDGEGAVGQITANQADASLDNSRKWFTSTYTKSPFYKLLRPKMRAEFFAGLEVDVGIYEFLTLGIFYTGQWNTSSTGVEATFTSYDRLREVMETPVPQLPAYMDTSVSEMLQRLFESIGLVNNVDFTIDPSINVPLRVGWYMTGKVGDNLQTYSEAGYVSINVNRQNVIKVKPYRQTGTAIETYTDDDLIMTADQPHLYREVCTGIEMDLNSPTFDPAQSLARMENVVIEAGATLDYVDVQLSPEPVAEVSHVRVLGANNMSVSNLSYGSGTVNFSVTNGNTTQVTVKIEVFGSTVKNTASKIISNNDNIWGEKKLTMTNQLIQFREFAEEYAFTLSNFLGDSHRKFVTSWRVDPRLELGDIINLTDNMDEIIATDVSVLSNTIRFDGGFEGELVALKKIQ